jgi:hypothetical protein
MLLLQQKLITHIKKRRINFSNALTWKFINWMFVKLGINVTESYLCNQVKPCCLIRTEPPSWASIICKLPSIASKMQLCDLNRDWLQLAPRNIFCGIIWLTILMWEPLCLKCYRTRVPQHEKSETFSSTCNCLFSHRKADGQMLEMIKCARLPSLTNIDTRKYRANKQNIPIYSISAILMFSACTV